MNRHLVLLVAGVVAAGMSCKSPALDRNDVGVYGNAWTEYVLEHPQHFDFLIYQARMQRATAAEIPETVEALAKAGVGMVLDMQFYEDGAQRGMREGAPPMKDMKYYEELFASTLEQIPQGRIDAMTLEEENVHWDGRAEFLSTLYTRVKARYPHYAFYQWYSPRRKPSIAIPGKTWPNLPADGWVTDLYTIYGEDFDEYLNDMSELKKPLLGVVWVVPQWRVADKSRSRDSKWWDETGWRMFYSQVATYRKYKAPVAFYAATPRGTREEGSVALYSSDHECDRKFFEALVSHTLPKLKSGDRLSLQIPARRPEWILGHCG